MTDESNDPTTQSVVIERTIEAPVASVWHMWTDADRFASWYGPMGATIRWHVSTCESAAIDSSRCR